MAISDSIDIEIALNRKQGKYGGFYGCDRPSDFENGQCDLEIEWMTLKNNNLQTLNRIPIVNFFGPCDLQI